MNPIFYGAGGWETSIFMRQESLRWPPVSWRRQLRRPPISWLSALGLWRFTYYLSHVLRNAKMVWNDLNCASCELHIYLVLRIFQCSVTKCPLSLPFHFSLPPLSLSSPWIRWPEEKGIGADPLPTASNELCGCLYICKVCNVWNLSYIFVGLYTFSQLDRCLLMFLA